MTLKSPVGRVALLGGAGLIGRYLSRRLRRAGISTLVVDLVSSDEADESRVADLSGQADVQALVRELCAEGIDAVVYLAAYYDFRNRPDPRYSKIEAGLRFLVTAMQDSLRETPLLYASSMASMAPTEPGTPLTESSPKAGLWAYPAHKLRCEEILETEGSGLCIGELVLAGVYTDWCELVPLYQHIERVRNSALLRNFYPGPTDRGLTYVHVEDAAEAFLAAIGKLSGKPGVHRFLIGESRPVTFETIQQVAAHTFLGEQTLVLPIPRALARVGAAVFAQTGVERFVKPWMIEFSGEHFEFDLTRVRTELGWTPAHDLNQELDGICARARDEVETWRRLNEARPW